jgi:hypothetical protein
MKMEHLFRFLMLRPAGVVKPKDIRHLHPSYVDKGTSKEGMRSASRGFIEKGGIVKSEEELFYADTARAVHHALQRGPLSAKDVDTIVQKSGQTTLEKITSDDRFTKDTLRLVDSLVAMKITSNSAGGDAAGYSELMQGYDAIERAASGADPVSLRVLSIDSESQRRSSEQPPIKSHVPKDTLPSEREKEILGRLNALDSASATLKTVPASGFRLAEGVVAELGVSNQLKIQRLDSNLENLKATEQVLEKEVAAINTVGPLTSVEQPWLLSHAAMHALSADVRNTLAETGIDLRVQALPSAILALDDQRTALLGEYETLKMPDSTPMHVLGYKIMSGSTNDYVGWPVDNLPTGHGNIKPVGIGDLLVVKQHVLRYEGGDLAHVENVLKTEKMSRDTRRLERTEQTVFVEIEKTKEEQRDTQTTDRFSLKRETSDTIKSDASFKAGVAVDAKYGPFVEVKANADFSTATSSESSAKTATEFSKDVVDRSVSKLVERVMERRSTTTISEFEEKFSHGFDNTTGAGHVSGYYQWINKVMQAQVYNYGKRLLFDVTVPEPGTNFILAEIGTANKSKNLVKPAEFTLTADQINAGNYALWGQKYGTVGLEPPPLPVKSFSKAFDATVPAGPHQSTKSDSIPLEDGYVAKYALFQRSSATQTFGDIQGNPFWQLQIGNNWINAMGSTGYVSMANETTSVPVAYIAFKTSLLSATIEIFCQVTDRAVMAWKLKTHAAISQAYQAKLEAYKQAVAQLEAAAGNVISGRNPLFNMQLITTELRKQCLTLVTAQQFTAFGALQTSSEGYAEPNLYETSVQMPYVRFFEQAFEWEHLVYFFYPYFWGWKPAWNQRLLLDDVDPAFADFLRAGAARVVFPVRPGFEAAVIHFLETGEIWNGGPPPDISSSFYVPIIKEIEEATGAPGSEMPVGDPWLVHLPTTLVRLRPNNDLPTWQKVNEEWQPSN